jgi:DegV family protein with EDD domain
MEKMMKILTDRAANLSPEDEQVYGLQVAPLYIQFPDEEVESSSITPDELYERMEAIKPLIPTTAMPSVGTFQQIYDDLALEGEAILSIHLSSGLSGTIQTSRLGAEQTGNPDITIYDSMTLSGGQRFQAIAASLAVRAGWALDAVLDLITRIREKSEVIYTLDTLEYLAHGGRIGRVQSLLSSVLNIKPIIHVDKSDGEYSTVGKARTLKRAVGSIISHLEELYGRDTPLWTTILHGQLTQEAEEMAAGLKEKLRIERLEIMRVTPILGVHTGPGIVGAAAVPFELMSGLF